MQMGQYVARRVECDLTHRPPPDPFSYFDKGTMATIGRSKAVALIGKLKISGWLAWVSWLFVHLIFLVGFRNKLSVLIQWTYSYFAYKRGSRIIANVPAAKPKVDGGGAGG
jgi:NADH dehydrogenase